MGITKTEGFTTIQNELAVLAKAIGHPARIAIIEYLLKTESCICGDIVNELPLAQPTVSQHLKELKNAGLIKGNIEKSIEQLDHIVTRLNAKLSGEKKLTGEFAKLLQNLKESDDGASIMLEDSTDIYNKKYMKNWEMVIGILIVIFSMFKVFKK